jgi:hypothetical protein
MPTQSSDPADGSWVARNGYKCSTYIIAVVAVVTGDQHALLAWGVLMLADLLDQSSPPTPDE